jgi:TPP-dependent 2-oxoacid decarboxylase
MQYGSIGWSVGATLGYVQAMPDKRLIACIGDGSFQVKMQGFLFQILKHCFTINKTEY